MLSKPYAYALLVGAAIAAAGGGAYFAARQTETAIRSSAAAIISEEPTFDAARTGAADAIEASPAVEETETVIDEVESLDRTDRSSDVARPAPPPLPVPKARPAARSQAAARPPSPPARPAQTEVAHRAAPEPESGTEPARAAELDRPPEPAVEADADEPEAPWVGLTETWPRPAADAAPEPIDSEPFDPDLFDRPLDAEPVLLAAEPELEELTVPSDSVIGLQLDSRVSSDDAQIEDEVDARVTRDVMAGDEVAIPAGTRMIGSVVLVERGGKVKKRARLGIKFHTIVMGDSTEMPVETETIYREGDSRGGKSAGKIGGAAVTGAVLGAIFGGSRGAVFGGSTGAAGGTIGVLTGSRSRTTFLPGMNVTVRLLKKLTVLSEK